MPEVYSVNQEASLPAQNAALNKSRVKFEMVNNLPEPPKAKGSGLGKMLMATGALSQAGWFLGPVGWVGAAFGQGFISYGRGLNSKAAQKQFQPEATPVFSTPGFGSPATDPTLAVVAGSRWGAAQDAMGGMK